MTGRAEDRRPDRRDRGSSPSCSGSSSGSSRSGAGTAPPASSPRASTRAAPAFTLSRLDAADGELSIADLKGKPVVVNFWASWCIPCKGEAPALQKTYEQYRSQGLVVLGVDAQDFRGDAKRFARRYGISYPSSTTAPARRSASGA